MPLSLPNRRTTPSAHTPTPGILPDERDTGRLNMASGLPDAPKRAIEEMRNRGRYSLAGEYAGDGLPSDLEGGESASGKGQANPPGCHGELGS